MNVAASIAMVQTRIANSRQGRGSIGIDRVYACAAGVAVGEAVYVSDVNTVAEANATDLTKAPCIGIVIEKPTSITAKVRSYGPVTLAGLVAQTTYYLATTDGAVTTAAPTGADDVIQQIGVALNSTTLFVQCTQQTSRGPDGSVDTPTYGFAGAGGLGMYRPSSASIGFSAGGVLVLGIESTVVTNTQNLTFSGTSPTIFSTGTNQGLSFRPNGTGSFKWRNAANSATVFGIETVASGNAGVSARYTDISGTPGDGVANTPIGRAAFAAAGSAAVIITNDLVGLTSVVNVQLEGAADGTLTSILSVTLAAGSFTVTGNAAATATKKFSFVVINPTA